ncbi:cadherin-like domain-containing protein [Bacteriovoracales bacterium]|nr:cadherin-like domain-containing protein [Bacteriovoracales bacterium]
MISFLKKRILNHFLAIFLLWGVMASCIPDVASNKGTCDTGEIFNKTTRSCVVTSFISIPTLSNISINEDVSKNVILSYRDHDDDHAASCYVTGVKEGINLGGCSCLGGVCSVVVDPSTDWNGQSEFSYSIEDNDGSSDYRIVSVNVISVNDTPSVTGATIDATEDLNPDMTVDLSTYVKDDTDDTHTFTIIQDASLGDITPTTETGIFTFTEQENVSGLDSFKFQVVDSQGVASDIVDMTIDIASVPDPPDVTSATFDITEDSTKDVIIRYVNEFSSTIVDPEYKDVDSDETADSCEIEASSDYGLELYDATACTCHTDGTCSFTLRAGKNAYTQRKSLDSGYVYRDDPSVDTSYRFFYYVTVDGDRSFGGTVDVDILEIPDLPIAFSQDIDATESNTIDASSYNFTINDATDADIYDSTTEFKFYIKEAPSFGTLSGCTASGDSTFDAYETCTYKPDTGNLTGIGEEASTDLKGVKYTSKYKGLHGNGIRINILPDATTDKEFVKVEGQSKDVTIDIYIHVVPGDTTQDGVLNLINNDAIASQFITAATSDTSTPQADNSGDSTNDYLSGGKSGADYFSYYVVDNDDADSSNASALAYVHFNIDATDDTPTLCQYSLYEDFPECGLNDCVGHSSPKGNLAPSTSDVYYYDKSSSVCWKSNGTTNTSWEVVTSYIANQNVTEKNKIVISGIRLDEGGADTAEDSQKLRLGADITSDNSILIPGENIKFYYGGSEISLGNIIDSTSGLSADANEFKVEINPVLGQSGTSNITFKIIEDDSSIDITVTFKVTINATSAQHNGWVAISSLGPKVNKYGQVRDESYICPYSETKCSDASCSGSVSPVGSVNPDSTSAIYYDSNAGSCYYAAADSSSGSWQEFSTYCPISQSDLAPECNASSRASCLFNVDTSSDIVDILKEAWVVEGDVTVDATSDYNNIYYNLKTNKCYRSVSSKTASSISLSDLEEISAPASVTLKWNAFTISPEGSPEGYNVYRRIALDTKEFNYNAPINKTMITSTNKGASCDTEKCYVDNGTNSKTPPIPGTTYFYEVRPVLKVGESNIPTDTSEVYKTVRLVAPPNNMAFVHQSMANKGVCSLMNKESDPRYQNDCTYQGPGEGIEDDGTREEKYDLKHHLLVDRFEAGCNFTNPPVCNGTNDGSCIRISDPTGDANDASDNVDATDDTVFYDRGSGNCMIKVGIEGTGYWKTMDASTDLSDEHEFDHRYAELPPFVNVAQEFSHDFCKLRSMKKVTNILGISSLSNIAGRLPSRKEQIAYSLWTSTKTTSEVQVIEEGLSLGSTSKCNTASANGLTAYFSDSNHPDSNTLFTIPGSKTSNIRSLMTGSSATKGTSSCVSHFGIQDAVGNVKEWVYDRIQCSTLSTCEGIASGDTTWDTLLPTDSNPGDDPDTDEYDGTGDNFKTSDTYDAFKKYKLDGKIGPCRDSNSDGECDSYMGEWEFDDQFYSAGRFIIPMGLPAHTDFPNNYSSDISSYLFEIGPTSGITNARLANDKFILNSHHIFAEKNGCGSLATGGSYLDNGGAGVFHLEAIPCTDTSYQYITVGQVSIKALHGKDPPLKITIKTRQASNDVSHTYGDSSVDISIDLTADANYDTLRTLLNGATVDATVDVELSEGTTGSETVDEVSTTSFNIINSSPKRPDVGFRCVIPLEETDTTFQVLNP